MELGDLRLGVLSVFKTLPSADLVYDQNSYYGYISDKCEYFDFFDRLGEELGIDFSFVQKNCVDEILSFCSVKRFFNLKDFSDLIWIVFYSDYYLSLKKNFTH